MTTVTEFDPLKAAQERFAGLADVARLVNTRAREAERKYAEAEAEHGAMRKLAGFVTILLTQARDELRAIEDQLKVGQ